MKQALRIFTGAIFATLICAPGIAAAQTGGDAFAQGTAVCIARQSGSFAEPVKLTDVEADDPVRGNLDGVEGQLFKVTSSAGRVYVVVSTENCLVLGYDVQPADVFASVKRTVEGAPYGAAPFEHRSAQVWNIETPNGPFRVIGVDRANRMNASVVVTVVRRKFGGG